MPDDPHVLTAMFLIAGAALVLSIHPTIEWFKQCIKEEKERKRAAKQRGDDDPPPPIFFP